MSEAMIQADGLVKIYKTKQTEVLALQGLDLDNLEGTARALCEKNNVNMEQLAAQIQGFANSK